MASTYPGSLDAFTTIASDKKTSDSVGGRTHRDMHNDLGDAVEAVQAELGTDPAGSFSTVKARLDALVAYAAKTSAYTATVADHTLNVTSGTFTLDLPAASTCTGQSLKVKNSGTGVVTLDGNSSETVEGIATFPLGPGSYVEVTSTGSAWILTGGTPDTGWRSMASLIASIPTLTLVHLSMRRVGAHVAIRVSLSDSSSAETTLLSAAIPTGFRPPTILSTISNRGGVLSLSDHASWQVLTTGSFVYGVAGASTYSNEITWITSEAWPTSLPGVAA